jgi:peptidoglycan hydrolase CwlO-like protein
MKYKAQHDENVKLEQSIKMLEEKLGELQGHFREVEGQEVPLSSHDHMSENNLKQYVKKLERRKAELQGELKDCEWRLNQESIALQKTLKERDAASTELSEVLASTTDSKAKKKTKSSGSSPVAAVKSKSKTKF